MASREETRHRLEEERNRLVGEVERAAEEPDEYVGQENSYYGNHLADVGSDTFEEEKAQALEAHLRGLLTQVEAALERLDNGTYGICENCGKEIAPERLEALPYATLCLDCASGRKARTASRA